MIPDREPQPSDGPDYHADHAAWSGRRPPPMIGDSNLEVVAFWKAEHDSLVRRVRELRASLGLGRA